MTGKRRTIRGLLAILLCVAVVGVATGEAWAGGEQVCNYFLHDEGVYTYIQLTNPTDHDLTVTFKFYGRGTPWEPVSSYIIAAGGQTRAFKTGTESLPIVGLGVDGSFDQGAFTITVTGGDSSELISDAYIFFTNGSGTQMPTHIKSAKTGSFGSHWTHGTDPEHYTFFALFNHDSTATDLKVSLRNLAGTVQEDGLTLIGGTWSAAPAANTPTAGETTYTASGTDWTPDAFVGMKLYPDEVANPGTVYTITGNTATTIIVTAVDTVTAQYAPFRIRTVPLKASGDWGAAPTHPIAGTTEYTTSGLVADALVGMTLYPDKTTYPDKQYKITANTTTAITVATNDTVTGNGDPFEVIEGITLGPNQTQFLFIGASPSLYPKLEVGSDKLGSWRVDTLNDSLSEQGVLVGEAIVFFLTSSDGFFVPLQGGWPALDKTGLTAGLLYCDATYYTYIAVTNQGSKEVKLDFKAYQGTSSTAIYTPTTMTLAAHASKRIIIAKEASVSLPTEDLNDTVTADNIYIKFAGDVTLGGRFEFTVNSANTGDTRSVISDAWIFQNTASLGTYIPVEPHTNKLMAHYFNLTANGTTSYLHLSNRSASTPTEVHLKFYDKDGVLLEDAGTSTSYVAAVAAGQTTVVNLASVLNTLGYAGNNQGYFTLTYKHPELDVVSFVATKVSTGSYDYFYIPSQTWQYVQEPYRNPIVAGFNVFVHNGEFFEQKTDLVIPGRGFDFAFTRTYRSRSTYKGPLGHGWDHNYNQRLVRHKHVSTNGSTTTTIHTIDYFDGTGRKDLFTQKWDDTTNKTRYYQGPAGIYDEIVETYDIVGTVPDTPTQFKRITKNRFEYIFATGQIKEETELVLASGTWTAVSGYDLTDENSSIDWEDDRYNGLKVYPDVTNYSTQSYVIAGTTGSTKTLTLSEPPTNAAQGDSYEIRTDMESVWVAKLTELKDRNGNNSTLTYTGEDLTRVVDTLGRWIDFSYTSNKLDSITEFTYTGDAPNPAPTSKLLGRQIDYERDSDGDLVAVVYPAVTFYRNDTQSSKKIGYVYSYKQVSGSSTHQLEKIYNPNETQEKATAPFLEVVPSAKAVVESSFNVRGEISTQTVNKTGSTSGSFSFDNSMRGSNLAVVANRRGHFVEHVYSAEGHPLLTTIIDKDDTSKLVKIGKTFNAAGQVQTITHPNGNGVTFTYDTIDYDPEKDRDTNQFTHPTITINLLKVSNLSRGNLLEVRRKTNMAALDNDTNDIYSTFTYQAQFNAVKESTNPEGHKTTYTIDANKGNLTTIKYPTVTALDGYRVVQSPQESFTYNGGGQLLSHTYPKPATSGSVTDKFQYYKVGNPDSASVPADILDVDSATAGSYLARTTADQGEGMLNIEGNVQYDLGGNLLKGIDHRGNASVTERDALGRPTSVTDPYSDVLKFRFHANGTVYQSRLEKGTTTFGVVTNKFDILGNRTQGIVALDLTNPASEISALRSKNIVTDLEHDENDNLKKVTDPTSKLSEIARDYRDITNKSILGSDTTHAPIYVPDANGNMIKVTDMNGAETEATFDGFDRQTWRHYAIVGGQSSPYYNINTIYDKNGNVTDIKTYHHTSKDTPGDGSKLLGWTEFEHDQLDRLYKKVVHVYSSTFSEITTATTETRYAYFLNSQVKEVKGVGAVGTAGARDVVTTMTFDSLGRSKTVTGTKAKSADTFADSVAYVYDDKLSDGAGGFISRVTITRTEYDQKTAGTKSYVSEQYFDKSGRLFKTVRKETGGSDRIVVHTLDTRGQPTKTEIQFWANPTNQQTSPVVIRTIYYLYDNAGRLEYRLRDIDVFGASYGFLADHYVYYANGQTKLYEAGTWTGTPPAGSFTVKNRTEYLLDAKNRVEKILFKTATGTTGTVINGVEYKFNDGTFTSEKYILDASQNVVQAVKTTTDHLYRTETVYADADGGATPFTYKKTLAFTLDKFGNTTLAESFDDQATPARDSLVEFNLVDSRGLPTGVKQSGASGSTVNTVAYGNWDKAGNLGTLTYPGTVALTLSNDIYGRRHEIKRGANSVATYTFQGPGKMRTRTGGNGSYLEVTYNNFEQVTLFESWKQAAKTNQIARFAYGHDTFDRRKWAKTLRAPGSDPDNEKSFHFSYDKDSQMTVVKKGTLNGSNEIASPTWTDTTSYTPTGNRETHQRIGVGAIQWDFNTPVGGGDPGDDPLNRYVTMEKDNSTVYSRTHDERGNLTDDGISFNLKFDYRNLLLELKNRTSAASVGSYGYDAMNRRVKKWTYIDPGSSTSVGTGWLIDTHQSWTDDEHNGRWLVDSAGAIFTITDTIAADKKLLLAPSGSTPAAGAYNIVDEKTRYLYHGWQVIEERDPANNLLRSFVYGNSIDEVVQMETAEANAGDLDGDGGAAETFTFYYHTNVQGDVTHITLGSTGFRNAANSADLASGAVVESYEYDPYGAVTIYDDGGTDITTTGSKIRNPYLFQGRRYDPESKLYYFRNRYYDPVAGRFISRDPAGFVDGPNLYAFVNNSPINFTDPMGLLKGWQRRELDREFRKLRSAEANLDAREYARAYARLRELTNRYLKTHTSAWDWSFGDARLVVEYASRAGSSTSPLYIAAVAGETSRVRAALLASERAASAAQDEAIAAASRSARQFETNRLATLEVLETTELAIDVATGLPGLAKGAVKLGAKAFGKKIAKEVGEEMAEQALKQGIKQAAREALEQAAKNSGRAIAFAKGMGGTALDVSRRTLQHAHNHLLKEGVITLAPNSNAAIAAFKKIAINVLENPRATFDNTLKGGRAVKGFLGSVGGRDVIIYVSKETGQVVTAIVPKAATLAKFGLK